MENLVFEIKRIGKLKYSRLKSLSILRKEINSFDYCYTMTEVKELLDSILNNTLKERFNLEFKHCFDIIFDNIEYVKYDDTLTEQNFSDNWISRVIRIPILSNYGGGYRLEYDGKYITLCGKDKNYKCMIGDNYEEMVLIPIVEEIRNANPQIIETTDSEIVVSLGCINAT